MQRSHVLNAHARSVIKRARQRSKEELQSSIGLSRFLKEERCPEASTGTKSADEPTRIWGLHLLPHFNVDVKCHAQVDIKDHYVH